MEEDYEHLYFRGDEEKLGIARHKKLSAVLGLATVSLAQYESHELKEDWAALFLDYCYYGRDAQRPTEAELVHDLEPRCLNSIEESQSAPANHPRAAPGPRFVGAIQNFWRSRLNTGSNSPKELSTPDPLLQLKQWQAHNLNPDDRKDLSETWLYREPDSLYDWSAKTLSGIHGVFLKTAASYQLGGKLVVSNGFDTAMTRAEMRAIIGCIDEINDRTEAIYENFLQAVVVSISQTAARVFNAHLEIGDPLPKLRIIEKGPWYFSKVDKAQNDLAMRRLTAAMMALPKSSPVGTSEITQVPSKLRARFLQTAHDESLEDRDLYTGVFLNRYYDIDELEHLVEHKPIGSLDGLCVCLCEEEPRRKGNMAENRKALKDYKKNYPNWRKEERYLLERVFKILAESHRLRALETSV